MLLVAIAVPALAQQTSAAEEKAPTSKQILRLLMSLQDVPLSSDESCKEAGTKLTDRDLGDYMSGWLANLKRGKGSNWISADAKPMTVDDAPGWKCLVMFHHVDGEDRWGWGVSFQVRSRDRKPVKGSVRCEGAG